MQINYTAQKSLLLNKPYFYTLSKSMTEILQLTLVIASFNASIF